MVSSSVDSLRTTRAIVWLPSWSSNSGYHERAGAQRGMAPRMLPATRSGIECRLQQPTHPEVVCPPAKTPTVEIVAVDGDHAQVVSPLPLRDATALVAPSQLVQDDVLDRCER